MTPSDDSAAPPAAAPSAFEPQAARQAPAAGVASLEHTVERLVQDLLRDRRSERRWRVFFRLAWFGLFLAVAYAIFVEARGPSGPVGPHTALVEIKGEIAGDSDASAEAIVSGLRSAFEDAAAKAIVLRVNSPGGSPVQAGIVHDELQRLKAKHGKKVYAVVEEVCASAAYYVAAAADEIFVDRASIVGSIGVLIDGFGFVGTLEKLGIERRLLTAGENKGMLDPFSPQNERQVAHAQAMIDEVHRQFIAAVKQGRGDRLKDAPEMFSGLFWNGEQAIALGLADRTGNLDFVAREVVQAEDVIDYTPRGNLAERLARRFGAGVGESLVMALRPLAPALR